MSDLQPKPHLSVIVPTYCEAENVPRLFAKLTQSLKDYPWDMIIVDDNSPDETYNVAFTLARTHPNVRCLRRIHRSGLAGAVIEGWLSTSADFVAVIDGDLQHDESLLPIMYTALLNGEADLAIGTRIADPTQAQGLSPLRQRLSNLGKWVFARIAGIHIEDPMSGFFMIKRSIIAQSVENLSPDGFKILVDLLLTTGFRLKIAEIPYVFRPREVGKSKLSPLVGIDFLGLVAHHASKGLLPTRFVLFALIGGVGLGVHLSLLTWLINSGYDFTTSQTYATLAAMISNFILNNEITYRATQYRGLSQITGFLLFATLCSVGAIANVNLAHVLYNWRHGWELAGLAGACIGVVWNYAASTTFVWRKRRK